MPTDVEIAESARLRPIDEVAARIALRPTSIEKYGAYKAKVHLEAMTPLDERRRPCRVVAVTAMSPTSHGEGKTVTAIGLIDALNRLGKPTIGTLRQPSLGPIFGLKGGATGGGRAQIVPRDDINLHFTGDFHAVAAAQNLLAALVDNHLFHGNRLRIDPDTIDCNRTVDIDNRSLRRVIFAQGRPGDGTIREGAFDIVAACEVMAILAQATSRADLARRLAAIVIGRSREGRFVTAADLGAEGAMAALLQHAVEPNLVQTLEGNPVLVHAGPFANVAHGNSSVIADLVALGRADYLVTEAGFGTDCGFEKLVDVKCRVAGYQPDLAVLVVTSRALRWHGETGDPTVAGPDAVRAGCANMAKHLENIAAFGCPCVVAINVFDTETDEELAPIEEEARRLGARVVRSEAHARGSAGTLALAEAVVEAAALGKPAEPLYPLAMDLPGKIEVVAKRIYGAASVEFSDRAKRCLDLYEAHGYGVLPVCIAKTQKSLSHDAKARNRPVDFVFPVEDVRLYAGAGYALALAGSVLTMPGLPEVPAAETIDVDDQGRIRGI